MSIKEMPTTVKASLAFVICSILQKGIQFITVPLFTRLLTTQQYGQFSMYQSWLAVISVFATFNLAAGVFNNGMLQYENDRNRYISAMQGLSTTLTAAVFIVYVLNIPFWNSLLNLPTVLVLVMLTELLAAPALAFWSARQRFEYKYVALVAVTLLIAIISPAVSLFAVSATTEKGYARIAAVALVNICGGLIFYSYNLAKGKTFFHKKYWKFSFLFNLPLIPHYLSGMVLAQADRIMIEKLFGQSEVAIYSVAYSISVLMGIVTSSINGSFVPWTYQQMKHKNYETIKKAANALMLFVAAISVLPVLFAPEIVKIMAPPSYHEAIWVIPPVATSVYFTFLYALFGNIEFYFQETKFIMVASVIGAAANIVLNAIFMPLWGYMVAGYTTMACYILFSAAHYIFMRKTCEKHIEGSAVYDLRTIGLISAGLMCGVTMIAFTYKLAIIRFLVAIVLLMVCVWKKQAIKAALQQLKQ